MQYASAQIILSESFENSFPPTGWLITNNGTGNNFTQNVASGYASDGVKSLMYGYHSTNAANAWLFTSAVALNAGDIVNITFDKRIRSISYHEALKFTVGIAQTPSAQTTVLADYPDLSNSLYSETSVNYTATVTGTYFFAFNCYSAANMYNLYVDNLVIKKMGNADAFVSELVAPVSKCDLSASEDVSIKIKNTGLSAISNFPVKYTINGVGEIIENMPLVISPNDSAVFTFSTKANLTNDGFYMVKAYSASPLDNDLTNDTVCKEVENPIEGMFSKFEVENLVIPDNNPKGITSSLVFCGLPNSLNGTNLKIAYLSIDSLIHPNVSDIDLYLISPSNDTVLLCSYNGGSGDNFLHVVFKDEATTNISTITSGGIPAGNYHPYDSLGFSKLYNGQNPNGTWNLIVKDFGTTNFGKFYKWTLAFETVTEINNETLATNVFKAFPNPTNGNLTIDYKGEGGEFSVSIVDYYGRTIYIEDTRNIPQNYSLNLNLSSFSKGVYFLKLNVNGKIEMKKVTLQ